MMGVPPMVVDQMSVWEFNAMWGGWAQMNLANPDAGTPEAPSPAEYHDMVRRLGG